MVVWAALAVYFLMGDGVDGLSGLIAVACSLLDRQIAALEKAFVGEGGFTERLYRVRTAARGRNDSRDRK